MQQKRTRWLWIIYLVCILSGWQVGIAYTQDENLDYAGTRDCRSCHRSYANDQEETIHFRTLIEVAEAEDDNVILADFDLEDDSRITPFDDETRSFTVDDVVFTLGAGQHYQAYVTEVDKNMYRVLPAQWNVADEMWIPLPLADEWTDTAYDFNSQCAACHTTDFDAEELTWEEAGVQCEACHGPGLNHVEFADNAGSSISDDEYDDLSSAINFALDGQVCGQCHSRGMNEETGLPIPVGYHPGMDLLDESVFTPVDIGNEDAWFATGHAKLPNMQFNEWSQSSHPMALVSARESEDFDASCLTCHSVAQRRVDYLINEDWVDEDDFDKLSVLDAHSFGVTCVSCHNPHEVDNDTFLIDEEPYALCISCHSNGEDNDSVHHPVQEMYEGLDLIENIEPIVGAHFNADEGPTCTTCHMQSIETKSGMRQSHTFHPVSPEGASKINNLQDACTTCHTEIEDPVQMQGLIDSIQSNVADRISIARDGVTDESPEWVRATLSMIEGDGSRGIHNFAYTDSMLSAIETEFGSVGATVSDIDIAQLVADSLPPIEITETPLRQPIVPPIGGLTAPSLFLLGLFSLIILVSAYTFFVRGRHDD